MPPKKATLIVASRRGLNPMNQSHAWRINAARRVLTPGNRKRLLGVLPSMYLFRALAGKCVATLEIFATFDAAVLGLRQYGCVSDGRVGCCSLQRWPFANRRSFASKRFDFWRT